MVPDHLLESSPMQDNRLNALWKKIAKLVSEAAGRTPIFRDPYEQSDPSYDPADVPRTPAEWVEQVGVGLPEEIQKKPTELPSEKETGVVPKSELPDVDVDEVSQQLAETIISSGAIDANALPFQGYEDSMSLDPEMSGFFEELRSDFPETLLKYFGEKALKKKLKEQFKERVQVLAPELEKYKNLENEFAVLAEKIGMVYAPYRVLVKHDKDIESQKNTLNKFLSTQRDPKIRQNLKKQMESLRTVEEMRQRQVDIRDEQRQILEGIGNRAKNIDKELESLVPFRNPREEAVSIAESAVKEKKAEIEAISRDFSNKIKVAKEKSSPEDVAILEEEMGAALEKLNAELDVLLAKLEEAHKDIEAYRKKPGFEKYKTQRADAEYRKKQIEKMFGSAKVPRVFSDELMGWMSSKELMRLEPEARLGNKSDTELLGIVKMYDIVLRSPELFGSGLRDLREGESSSSTEQAEAEMQAMIGRDLLWIRENRLDAWKEMENRIRQRMDRILYEKYSIPMWEGEGGAILPEGEESAPAEPLPGGSAGSAESGSRKPRSPRRESSLESWYTNDPVKIAIAARLEIVSRELTPGDYKRGLVHMPGTGPLPHGGYSGASTHSPQVAIERLLHEKCRDLISKAKELDARKTSLLTENMHLQYEIDNLPKWERENRKSLTEKISNNLKKAESLDKEIADVIDEAWSRAYDEAIGILQENLPSDSESVPSVQEWHVTTPWAEKEAYEESIDWSRVRKEISDAEISAALEAETPEERAAKIKEFERRLSERSKSERAEAIAQAKSQKEKEAAEDKAAKEKEADAAFFKWIEEQQAMGESPEQTRARREKEKEEASASAISEAKKEEALQKSEMDKAHSEAVEEDEEEAGGDVFRQMDKAGSSYVNVLSRKSEDSLSWIKNQFSNYFMEAMEKKPMVAPAEPKEYFQGSFEVNPEVAKMLPKPGPTEGEALPESFVPAESIEQAGMDSENAEVREKFAAVSKFLEDNEFLMNEYLKSGNTDRLFSAYSMDPEEYGPTLNRSEFDALFNAYQSSEVQRSEISQKEPSMAFTEGQSGAAGVSPEDVRYSAEEHLSIPASELYFKETGLVMPARVLIPKFEGRLGDLRITVKREIERLESKIEAPESSVEKDKGSYSAESKNRYNLSILKIVQKSLTKQAIKEGKTRK